MNYAKLEKLLKRNNINLFTQEGYARSFYGVFAEILYKWNDFNEDDKSEFLNMFEDIR